MFTGVPPALITDKIWQISELNETVKASLDGQFGSLWLQGEISNFSRPSSGHWYFTLKDADAAVRSAMFRFANQTVSFQPRDGLEVLVKAKVSLYVARGEYQIVVEKMLPSGEGQLRLQFEQLKKKLLEKGYFETESKKPLPTYPRAIGLITSPTGAAIRDILNVLSRRYPLADIWLYPTAVQGNDAAPQIVNALSLAQKHAQCDVLLIARGGGSLEDLWPFNEEIVANALYECTIPVVSGVGHETDITISDFVADLRAPTPSAAAEQITPNQADILAWLEKEGSRLNSAMLKALQSYQQKLDYLEKRLIHPKQRLLHAEEKLNRLSEKLIHVMQAYFTKQQYQLSHRCRALEAMNPLKVLARGFAVVKSENQIIKSVQQLKKNAPIEITLSEGSFNAEVTEIIT